MPIQIHGKEYVTCAERLKMVKESGKSFEVVESAPMPVGDRWLWRCAIKVDGALFVANAEVKLTNARRGSPDESNPMECGETSALARCLGFAGFGVIDSVASADEILRGESSTTPQNDGISKHTANPTTATSRPSQSVTEPSEEEVKKMIGVVKSLLAAHYQIPQVDQPAKWQSFKKQVLGLPVEDEGLSLSEVKRLRAVIDKKIEQAKGAA